MLLVVDAGNSQVVTGLYRGADLRETWRAATQRERTGDEYGLLFRGWLQAVGVAPESLDGIALASVTPGLTSELRRGIERFLGQMPQVVGVDMEPPIPIRYATPETVGKDRLLNALAARERYGAPCLVVDLGTATNLDAVSPAGEFVGGAIAPGVGISMEALYRAAPHLPRVPLARPVSVLGSGTRECLQAGAYYGFLGQLEGLIQRSCAVLGVQTTVVATGGLASLVAGEIPRITHTDPDLTLEGLRLTWERARSSVSCREVSRE
ncbi:MAG: type III pantothenate kinase [Armatimonadetes bacterium]|nr:type III pantothenate kinase [Armatimonadota bacterium]